MELLDLAIEEQRASLEEQLNNTNNKHEQKNFQIQQNVLTKLSNRSLEFEDIRLCVRNINISETNNLGEAFCLETEIKNIENLAHEYKNKAEESRTSTSKHITALTCYDVLNIIKKYLQEESAKAKAFNIYNHEPDGIAI